MGLSGKYFPYLVMQLWWITLETRQLLPPSYCSNHKQIHEIVHAAIPVRYHVPMCCVDMWICLKHDVDLSVKLWGSGGIHNLDTIEQHLPLWGKMSQIHQWCCLAPVQWSDSPHWGMHALHTLHRCIFDILISN